MHPTRQLCASAAIQDGMGPGSSFQQVRQRSALRRKRSCVIAPVGQASRHLPHDSQSDSMLSVDMSCRGEGERRAVVAYTPIQRKLPSPGE